MGSETLPLYRRLRRRAYAMLARAALRTAGGTPTGIGRAGGRGLARLAAMLRPEDVALARRNLATAFPDRDARWRDEVGRTATDRIGENLFDALTLERWAADGFARIAGDDTAALLDDLRRDGRGVLILTGHLGCWELLGAWLAKAADGLTVVTGVVRNEPVDRMLNDRRRRLGLRPVPRDGDLRPLLRALCEGGVAAVLLDQNVKSASEPAPFFGRPAPTATGFAALARRTGATVLPVALQRDGDGHRVVHLPPLRPEDHDGFADEAALLAAANAALAEMIARNPCEWVWFHDRWGLRDETTTDGGER